MPRRRTAVAGRDARIGHLRGYDAVMREDASRGDDAPLGAGRVVAGRYLLGDPLGTGGCGDVFRATDQVTGQQVALKVLRRDAAVAWPRVQREVLALRLLRLPGVVRLLDDGVHDGAPFIVMEIAEGRPFPGCAEPAEWSAIESRTRSLAETLARVHAAGVVHRDLKPSNIFVGADDRVTILDFGLSWGTGLGERLTSAGTVIGTPEYLAPEQFGAKGADARADLYAVGVMLYQALSGRRPHDTDDLMALISMRRSVEPTPLRRIAPGVPRRVADLVGRLLAIDPADRPQTAVDVISALFGGTDVRAAGGDLPRLGPPIVDMALALLRSGRSVSVWGRTGSGRTRLLEDVGDCLAAEGRRVCWLLPGRAPYESVTAITGDLDSLDGGSAAEVAGAVQAKLRAVLAGGAVIVADDADRIDRRSQEVLESVRRDGAVLSVTPQFAAADVRLAPLSEADLRALFRGPDRLYHLQEDGALELWHRTGGLPARIASEVGAWVRAGLADWDGDRLALTRDALDRLRGGMLLGDDGCARDIASGPRLPHLDETLAWIALAWPHSTIALLAAAMERPAWRVESEVEDLEREGSATRLADGRAQPIALARALHTWSPETRRAAHAAISRALPPGTAFRLRHLAAAGEPAEVVEEALTRAPELVRSGRIGDALVLTEIAVTAARAAGDPEAEQRALIATAKVTLVSGEGPARTARMLYQIERVPDPSPLLRRVVELLVIVRDAPGSSPQIVLRRLAELPPFEDLDLELVRQAARVKAALALPAAAADPVFESIERWAAGIGDRRAEASATSWSAHRDRIRGDYESAARKHLRAAERSDRVLARIANLLNASIAFLDCGRTADARAAADSAMRMAADCRQVRDEAHACSLLREIDYRHGAAVTPDIELVEAAATIGVPSLESEICLTEAAIAWRAGDLAVGRDLAVRTAARAVRGDARLLARSLAVACGDPAESAAAPTLVADIDAATMDDDVRVQALGLVAIGCPALAADLRSRVAALLALSPPQEPGLRLNVLSPREAAEGLAGNGNPAS